MKIFKIKKIKKYTYILTFSKYFSRKTYSNVEAIRKYITIHIMHFVIIKEKVKMVHVRLEPWNPWSVVRHFTDSAAGYYSILCDTIVLHEAIVLFLSELWINVLFEDLAL